VIGDEYGPAGHAKHLVDSQPRLGYMVENAKGAATIKRVVLER
jgi:hypothetical protein